MATGVFGTRLVVGGLAGLAAVAGGYTVAYPYVCFFYLFMFNIITFRPEMCIW